MAILLPPSNDLLLCRGRSKTRNEDVGVDVWTGLLSVSSSTFPDNLRRANPLGILIGM